MNKIKVTICGREYSLKSEEQPAYYIALAKKVEDTINQMLAQSSGLNIQSAAVLAALAAFDDAHKADESIDNIRTQVKEYVNDAGKARAERDEAYKEVEKLKLKISELENELSIARMKKDIDTCLTGKNNPSDTDNRK